MDSTNLSDEFLDKAAARVARFIQVLQPLMAPSPQAAEKPPARRRR